VNAAGELLTPRLRHWREDDEAARFEINRDPEVTRYLNRPVDRAANAALRADPAARVRVLRHRTA
jgi:hypothetical protein